MCAKDVGVLIKHWMGLKHTDVALEWACIEKGTVFFC